MNPTTSRVLRAPFGRRTWLDTAYVFLRLPVAFVGFVLVLVSLVVGAGLAVTFVGLPLLALSGLGARCLGSLHRRLANRLLTEPDNDGDGDGDGDGGDDGRRRHPVAPPPPFRPRPGFLGWLQAGLRDGPAWRSRTYLLATFPLTLVTAYVTVMLWGLGAFWLTSPLWWSDGGIVKAVLFPFVGLGMILAVPPVLRWLVGLDLALVRSWLGPSPSTQRVTDLEAARAHVVDDAAATLRRIERDLHDGTQAQLATLAMTLGQVKEKLEHRPDVPYDPDGALELAVTAHRHAKEALVELRDLARGIHPPVLDVGLDTALATLVERSAVPTDLHADVPVRAARSIEVIAYFTVAELLANVARHSQAGRARVEVTAGGGTLSIRVGDDGVGGARPRPGSGLAGLRERIEAVDGRLDVSSPAGGPTVVDVELPMRA